jgi:hypothetical protein
MIWFTIFNLGVMIIVFIAVLATSKHLHQHCSDLHSLKKMVQANHALILLISAQQDGAQTMDELPSEHLTKILEIVKHARPKRRMKA